MGGLDNVVLGLRSLRVAGQSPSLTQMTEVLPTGEELMHVGLVPGVEDDGIVG